VTLEANPGTLEAGRFAAYREAGVNRLSIGVQSFTADCLTRLGRIHGPDEAVASVESAKRAGFDRLNIDLMFGLPGQTPEGAVQDVEQALQLQPDHISYYQLTLEPHTLFYRQPPDRLPGETEEERIQQQGHALLKDAGFEHYEVSAFALKGGRCRHNLNYWQFGDYLAIGAGAHGKLTQAEPWSVHRRWRVRGPADYMAQVKQNKAIAGERRLDESDRVMEFMMNALRLQEGFAPALFVQRTGLPVACLLDRLSPPIERGLLEVTGDWVKPTELGRRFLDDLLASLL
jgi:oxygen-independent coproporphyrinogen-3 oxidase